MAAKNPVPTIIRVDITGPVGSGKTTIACEIARALAQAGRHVVHSEIEARKANTDRVVLIVDHSDDKAEPAEVRRRACGGPPMSQMISIALYGGNNVSIRADQIASVEGQPYDSPFKAKITTIAGKEFRAIEYPEDILAKIAAAEAS